MRNTRCNNLRACREACGGTREEAAAAAGVDPKTIYRYETGQQCPNVYTALKLAGLYHRSVAELFPLDGESS